MQTQSPSPTQQKQWVTFTEGRAPLSGEESLERDTRIDEAYQVPPLTWQTERALCNESDWLRAEGGEREERIGVSPATGTPPSGTLEWGGVVSSWCRINRLLPTNFDTQ